MTASASALDGIRVLDLTGARGNYCGKLFAELGADVVLVEPSQGSELRRRPPYVDGISGLDRSIAFAYHNMSKRSIVLDLDDSAGQRTLRKLAKGADLVVESFMPGEMADRGLSYEVLVDGNPGLVMTSITPFGQEGPLANCDAPDLVCLALGGLLYLGGYADGAPMRAPLDQAHMAGSLFAAVASMMAVLHSEATGEGQYVDVSIQESVALGLENAVQFYDLEDRVRRRTGGVQRQAGMGVFATRDGYVFVMAGGVGGNRFWQHLVDWLQEEDCPGVERIAGPEWNDRAHIEGDDAKEVFADVFGNFCLTRDKHSLGEAAQRWRVPLAPVESPSDVLGSPQLAHRRFFHELTVLPGRTHPSPGAPYVLSRTPWRGSGRPPELGEHTDEVLGEIGVARDATGSSEVLR